MGVLAVAQLLRQVPAYGTPRRRPLLQFAGEPIADCRIVGGGAGEGLGRKRLAQLQRGGTCVATHRRKDIRVVFRIDNYRDSGVVLGGGPDHGGATNVDVLYALSERHVLRNRLFERVEVDHQ